MVANTTKLLSKKKTSFSRGGLFHNSSCSFHVSVFDMSIKSQITLSSLIIIWSSFFESRCSGNKRESGSFKSIQISSGGFMIIREMVAFEFFGMMCSSGKITNGSVISSNLSAPMNFFFWGIKYLYCKIKYESTLSEKKCFYY